MHVPIRGRGRSIARTQRGQCWTIQYSRRGKEASGSSAPAAETTAMSTSRTIAAKLANSFGEATGLEVAALMYLAFILMALTLVINAFAEVILERTNNAAKGN